MVLNGRRYRRSWMLRPAWKNSGRSMKWKELEGNRMLLGLINKQASTYFLIVQRKALKAAEVFVTTVKHWNQGKNLNQKTVPLTWLPLWALNCCRKNNTGSCRNLDRLMQKPRAG